MTHDELHFQNSFFPSGALTGKQSFLNHTFLKFCVNFLFLYHSPRKQGINGYSVQQKILHQQRKSIIEQTHVPSLLKPSLFETENV